jgi:hypothetical protein
LSGNGWVFGFQRNGNGHERDVKARSRAMRTCARRCMGYIPLHDLSRFPLPATLRTCSRFCLEEQSGKAHAPQRTKAKLRWELMVMLQHLAAIRAIVPTRPMDRANSLGGLMEDDTRRCDCQHSSHWADYSQNACLSQRKALRMAKKQPSTFIMRQSSSSITQNLGQESRNDSLVSHALEVLGWYYDET